MGMNQENEGQHFIVQPLILVSICEVGDLKQLEVELHHWELWSGRPSGFLSGTSLLSVPQDATQRGATGKQEVMWSSFHTVVCSLCSSSVFLSRCLSTLCWFRLAFSIRNLRSLIFFFISARSWDKVTPRAWNTLTFTKISWCVLFNPGTSIEQRNWSTLVYFLEF